MAMEVLTVLGVILTVLSFGITMGRLIEKIERLDRRNDHEGHKKTRKNDRR